MHSKWYRLQQFDLFSVLSLSGSISTSLIDALLLNQTLLMISSFFFLLCSENELLSILVVRNVFIFYLKYWLYSLRKLDTELKWIYELFWFYRFFFFYAIFIDLSGKPLWHAQAQRGDWQGWQITSSQLHCGISNQMKGQVYRWNTKKGQVDCLGRISPLYLALFFNVRALLSV
jgi:hypothetical protein